MNESMTEVGIELLGQLKTTDLGDEGTPNFALLLSTLLINSPFATLSTLRYSRPVLFSHSLKVLYLF